MNHVSLESSVSALFVAGEKNAQCVFRFLGVDPRIEKSFVIKNVRTGKELLVNTKWFANSKIICDGGYLSGQERLPVDRIKFDEISEDDDGNLELSISTLNFNADRVFGTWLNTADNEDYLNVYAKFSCDTNTVEEDLIIVYWTDDNEELEFRYKLTEKERTGIKNAIRKQI